MDQPVFTHRHFWQRPSNGGSSPGWHSDLLGVVGGGVAA